MIIFIIINSYGLISINAENIKWELQKNGKRPGSRLIWIISPKFSIVLQRPLPGGIHDAQPQLFFGIDLFALAGALIHGQMHEMVVPAPDQKLGLAGHPGMDGVPT